jgi:hypothetical protein
MPWFSLGDASEPDSQQRASLARAFGLNTDAFDYLWTKKNLIQENLASPLSWWVPVLFYRPDLVERLVVESCGLPAAGSGGTITKGA